MSQISKKFSSSNLLELMRFLLFFIIHMTPLSHTHSEMFTHKYIKENGEGDMRKVPFVGWTQLEHMRIVNTPLYLLSYPTFCHN